VADVSGFVITVKHTLFIYAEQQHMKKSMWLLLTICKQYEAQGHSERKFYYNWKFTSEVSLLFGFVCQDCHINWFLCSERVTCLTWPGKHVVGLSSKEWFQLYLFVLQSELGVPTSSSSKPSSSSHPCLKLREKFT
jgi:hypothetical protein